VYVRGCALLQWSWQWEGPVSGGRRMECMGEWDMLSVWVQSERGDI
jgi:hypothetical protein